ncbi:error-prone DNA polymerase [Ramlibacter tataouinensis]|uniref:Error-prone DNA polymerase n=1 Tax=Ramlibacter tataouinensis (strain ATCC BAA-407 / DSM 14655 / LMG 21543 / TTB310) TaxID=365046 RepID=F5Y4S6_RAMTT|nr:error-prone DNA polymerase [Ramlibacter tataouinensis]AEG92582.1 Candidate DNA polymerase III alpha subunit, DnaE subfamily [Ramlibacter tataouinensis TTB310]
MPESPDKTFQTPWPEDGDLPPVLGDTPDPLPRYAELHCLSNFSFQRGASHPHELVERAYNLGYEALAITDECSVAGVVQAHIGLRDYLKDIAELEAKYPAEKRKRPFRLLYGAEFRFPEATLVALPRNTFGWGDLCEFITAARAPADKGEYVVGWECSDLALLAGCEILYVPRRDRPEAMDAQALQAGLQRAAGHFGPRLWLGVELPGELGDDLWLALLREAGGHVGVPLVACGGAVMHKRSRKNLLDVVTAVREGATVAECGFALQPNAQRYLHYRAHLAQVYPPGLLAATQEVARRCTFRLEDIQYNYPREPVPPGRTPMGQLVRLTLLGARRRYPDGAIDDHRKQIRHELRLIREKRYEMFFLTVEDIVRYARDQGILCQGRGSAANSLVCYCLGITEIAPEFASMLFERFISRERDEAPDIDVDFEHQRREQVIQYIYGKYGRERAAIAAVVVRYRTRMAIRDVGRALGVDARLVDAFAKDHFWFDKEVAVDRLVEVAQALGVEEAPHKLRLWLQLAGQLRGFPRHLSQHVGGFVLTQDKLTRLVPIEKASMPGRSVIQWDKDDLEAMNLLKVDVLALGMLSALRRCLQLANQWRGRSWTLQQLPKEDPAVYDMICRADTVGVFQIESRAQMSMLPRLKPREYYDLVVEVAIVRPGPIQGGMVHPYLKARERRRRGLPIHYIKHELAGPLGRTLGVPIFQEQVMQLAMVAAKFSADQADALRRSMAAWSRRGGVHRFREPLVEGMVGNDYPRDFAEGIFKQIEGFGEYGFPESHAAGFALLVYFSSWFKCHEPGCFLAAMLNAQPMGFYSPSQLIQDARRHGIEVRPVDVALSDFDCTLEPPSDLLPLPLPPGEGRGEGAPGQGNTLQPCVRLGLRLVAGLSTRGAQRIVAARAGGTFTSVEDLALRAALDLKDMNALSAADALSSLAGHRRQQVWAASATRHAPGLLSRAPVQEELLHLPAAPEGEDVVFDYAATGFSLRRHPLALLRPRLAAQGWLTAQALRELPHGSPARACGIVSMRQRPPTAKGTLFILLEDETGTVNVIVWDHVVQAQRDALLRSRLLAVEGVWQRDVDSGGRVRHLLARQTEDLTPLLGRLGRHGTRSRDFH